MVYFNCTKCGTGLKKSQVESHMYQCKSRLVCCIDCQKDFRDEEFKAHVKCLTESERYESKDFVSKANKGDIKQNSWMEKIGKAVEVFRGSAKAKSLLEKLVEYPNVPRKKAKFVNFIRNSFRYLGANDAQIEEIWTIIESFDKKPAAQSPPTTNGHHQNGSKPIGQTVEEEKPPTTKRKLDEIENAEEEAVITTAEFDWLEEIKRVCCKKENNEITLEKLEKKLYKKYKKTMVQSNNCTQEGAEAADENEKEEENRAKFAKRLSKKLKKLGPSISLIASHHTTTTTNNNNSSNHNGDQSIMVVKYLNDE